MCTFESCFSPLYKKPFMEMDFNLKTRQDNSGAKWNGSVFGAKWNSLKLWLMTLSHRLGSCRQSAGLLWTMCESDCWLYLLMCVELLYFPRDIICEWIWTFLFAGCATCWCVTAALTNPGAVTPRALGDPVGLSTSPSNIRLGDGGRRRASSAVCR